MSCSGVGSRRVEIRGLNLTDTFVDSDKRETLNIPSRAPVKVALPVWSVAWDLCPPPLVLRFNQRQSNSQLLSPRAGHYRNS